MSINTNIEKKDGYIHFILKGEFPGLKILDGFDKIIEASEKFDVKNILLDIRNFDYEISGIESYHIGEYISNKYGINMIKIACLRNKNKQDDFTEIVARNRGANFKLFTDEYEAINWLKD